jgi:hypothetical protein
MSRQKLFENNLARSCKIDDLAEALDEYGPSRGPQVGMEEQPLDVALALCKIEGHSQSGHGGYRMGSQGAQDVRLDEVWEGETGVLGERAIDQRAEIEVSIRAVIRMADHPGS